MALTDITQKVPLIDLESPAKYCHFFSKIHKIFVSFVWIWAPTWKMEEIWPKISAWSHEFIHYIAGLIEPLHVFPIFMYISHI